MRAILERIRATVRAAAPDAEETISYRIPAFRHHGMLVYFAAFERDIGCCPPGRGDSRIEEEVSPHTGEKRDLRSPLDRPIPHGSITRS